MFLFPRYLPRSFLVVHRRLLQLSRLPSKWRRHSFDIWLIELFQSSFDSCWLPIVFELTASGTAIFNVRGGWKRLFAWGGINFCGLLVLYSTLWFFSKKSLYKLKTKLWKFMLLEMQYLYFGPTCRRSRSQKSMELHSFHVYRVAKKISFGKQSCSYKICEAFWHLGYEGFLQSFSKQQFRKQHRNSFSPVRLGPCD